MWRWDEGGGGGWGWRVGVRIGASRLTSPAHEVDHEIDRRGSNSPAEGSAGAVCSGAGDRGRQQTVGVTVRRCAAAKACRCMENGRCAAGETG